MEQQVPQEPKEIQEQLELTVFKDQQVHKG
jgi:hypothetical protein